MKRFLASTIVALVGMFLLSVAAFLAFTVDLVEETRFIEGADVFDPATQSWSRVEEAPPFPELGPQEYPKPPEEESDIFTLPNGTLVAVPRTPYGTPEQPLPPPTVYVRSGRGWEPIGEIATRFTMQDFAALADGRVVVADREQALLIDPDQRVLTPLPKPPLDSFDGRLNPAGDRVYAALYVDPTIKISMLLPDEGKWVPVPASSEKRDYPNIYALTNGRLVLEGGSLVDPHPNWYGVAWMTAFVLLLGFEIFVIVVTKRRGVIHWGGTILGAVLGFAAFALGLLVLLAMAGGGHGRPLRLGRRVIRGRVHAGARRARGSDDPRGLTRVLLAHGWARDAALEHASIGAFERLARRLEAVDAPPELVARARVAAEEETVHAQLCLEQASRFAGRELSLAPLPEAEVPPVAPSDRVAALRELAVESLVDGTIGEGWAAAAAAHALADTRDPATRHALEIIARDEARHAAHGRDVVAWCIEAGGEPVRQAVQRAVQRERNRVRSRGLPQGRFTAALARHGRFTEQRPGALDRELRAGLSCPS